MPTTPRAIESTATRPQAPTVAALAFLATVAAVRADDPAGAAPPKKGVLVNDARALPGYTLIFPIQSTRTYLIDMQGRVARTWDSQYAPGQEAYLLEDGHLLRPAKMADSEAIFAGAGGGGRIQEFDEKGRVIWNFKFHNEKQVQHHAITRMPGGNIMMIVWERKTPEECIAAGVKPANAGETDILVDSLIEIQPAGKTGGKVVWEWHLWDHIIQDYDRSKPNYGDVAAHPDRIDANFERDVIQAIGTIAAAAVYGTGTARKAGEQKGDNAGNAQAFDRLKTIGYVGAGNTGSRTFQGYFPDWNHINSVAYNAKLDQLLISSRQFSEIYVIDHSMTTAEARGHTGGRSGKGGDILYRWGNPRAYRAGTEADQRLFNQHDAQWIPDGLPGAGHILVYNNGSGRPDGTNYSSVNEIVPPLTADGRYERPSGKPFGPDRPLWTFTTPSKEEFFSPIVCGTQRLANGNTLLANGFLGSIWEVTPSKEVVWKYIVPRDMKPGTEIRPGGAGLSDAPTPKRPMQVLPDAVAMWLGLSPDQKKSLSDFEAYVAFAVDAVLTEDQRDRLKSLAEQAGPIDFRIEPEPAEILTPDVVGKLGLSDEQKKRVEGLRMKAYARIFSMLSARQKKWFNTVVAARRSIAVGPDGPTGNAIFRAYRYPSDYPGLSHLDLRPGPTIDGLAKQREGK